MASKSKSSRMFPLSTTTRVSSGWDASISILLAMRLCSPQARPASVRNAHRTAARHYLPVIFKKPSDTGTFPVNGAFMHGFPKGKTTGPRQGNRTSGNYRGPPNQIIVPPCQPSFRLGKARMRIGAGCGSFTIATYSPHDGSTTRYCVLSLFFLMLEHGDGGEFMLDNRQI